MDKPKHWVKNAIKKFVWVFPFDPKLG